MELVLGLTCLTSCSDFLNRQPTNSGNADEAIATQRDAEVAINGMMFKMSSSSYYGRNFLLYGDAKGGDLTIYTNGRGNDNLYTFNHTPTSGTYQAFWSQIYDCIMQANNLIETSTSVRPMATQRLTITRARLSRSAPCSILTSCASMACLTIITRHLMVCPWS